MTLIIKNVKPDYVAAFKGLAKGVKAKVQMHKTDKEIAQKWEKEAKEAMRDYKAGKLKVYKSAKEMHEDILKNG